MTERNLIQAAVDEFRVLAEPVLVAGDSAGLERLLVQLGWRLEGLVGAGVSAVMEASEGLAEAIAAVAVHPLDDFEDVLDAAEAVGDALGRADDIRSALVAAAGPDLDPATTVALAEDLREYLLTQYLRRRSAVVYALARLLTLIELEQPDPLHSRAGELVRYPGVRPALRLDNVPKLLSNPVEHLKAAYVPAGGLVSDAAAHETATKLFGRIRNVLAAAGADVMVGLEDEVVDPGEPPDEALFRAMSAIFGGRTAVEADGELHARGMLGATVTIVPANREGAPGVPGPGLVVLPLGASTFERDLAGWRLAVTAQGTVPAMFVGQRRSAALDGGQAAFHLGVELTEDDNDSPLIVGAGGTRLELGRLTLSADAGVRDGQATFGFLAGVDRAALVVAAADGDGFLQSVLPAGGVRADFPLGIGWSNRTGLRFKGGAALEATLPVKLNLFGMIEIRSVAIALSPGAAADSLRLSLGARAGLKLGPIAAGIDAVGVRADVAFPGGGGNLGFANLERIAFKPPTGVALSIEAGAVTGGGFVFFDSERKQYAGGLHLEFERFTLNAIGLLTTRMPDGSPDGRPGFSLLVIVQASGFTPVPIGLGFTLTGVGGLLGINRTFALDVLRAGVRNRTLDSILFSREDPTPRGPQIVSTLQSVFPPAAGRHVFGPMVQLEWGTARLLTIEVALVLELLAPVRFVVLGRLHALLPREHDSIVEVHLDAVGVIDFGRREASIDASLYDSKVDRFALTGDMAMRASWGAKPGFALALGGFHPAYKPPGSFPALRPLALTLGTGDNPRLRCDAYLAITSNTVQIGARGDLYLRAGKFSLEGSIGFDALLHLEPFGLELDIPAHVSIKRGSRSLLGLDVRIHLTGPSPWHARVHVTIDILVLSATVTFEATFGPHRTLTEPQPIDLWPLLRDELMAPGNWSAPPPPQTGQIAALAASPSTDGVLVHPLGGLTVTQRRMPLERAIERLGTRPPAGDRRFAIATVRVGTVVTEHIPAHDWFAPAQYFRLSDAEALSAPSFDRMPSGVNIAAGATTYGNEVGAPLAYESTVISADDEVAPPPPTYTPSAEALAAMTGIGSAASDPARRTGRMRFAANGEPARVAEPRYVVARRDVLQPVDVGLLDRSWSAAEAARGGDERYQVALAHEVGM